jgi:hypothetical protein
VGSERVRGSEDSLELVSAVLTLYVRTRDEEGGRSLGGAVWRAAAVVGTELVGGSSGRVRRTNESTERDFLSFEGERVAVGGIKGPWTSMGGKTGLSWAGIAVVVVLEGRRCCLERGTVGTLPQSRLADLSHSPIIPAVHAADVV